MGHPAAGEWGKQPVPLTPIAFDLLVAFVRRSGHQVTKDDLLREVEPDTFVEEVNLTVHISGLRKALDRASNGSSMIETVPTHGYRFVAQVTITTADIALCKPDVLVSEPGGREFGQQPTKSDDAYRAYLLGRHEWNQRSKESLSRGIDHFQRAVDVNPAFAAAHSGLADCYAACEWPVVNSRRGPNPPLPSLDLQGCPHPLLPCRSWTELPASGPRFLMYLPSMPG